MAKRQPKSKKAVERARSEHSERVSVFQREFREDLQFWIQTDRKTAGRVLDIVEDVLRNPFEGIGKPEPLKYLGPDIWSRRLTAEHRVVYLVQQHRIDFLMCRYHY
jgi:toxin YoeB